VLRTNTDLNYWRLCSATSGCGRWSRPFRTAKHLFSTRPIFHKLDETIRGHVFCSFLALVLMSELEDRIAGLGRSGSWPQIIADLDSLTETEIEYDGKRFIVRSAPRPAASLACGPQASPAATVLIPPSENVVPSRARLALPHLFTYLVNRTVEEGFDIGEGVF
jgi:hypothetical protein